MHYCQTRANGGSRFCRRSSRQWEPFPFDFRQPVRLRSTLLSCTKRIREAEDQAEFILPGVTGWLRRGNHIRQRPPRIDRLGVVIVLNAVTDAGPATWPRKHGGRGQCVLNPRADRLAQNTNIYSSFAEDSKAAPGRVHVFFCVRLLTTRPSFGRSVANPSCRSP